MKYIIIFLNLLLIGNSFAQNYGGWIIADSLNEPRQDHSSVILPNGNILVSGGESHPFLSSCEIYNYQTGIWNYTNSMSKGRIYHHSILLNNNKVIVIGGYKIKSCEIFNPITETWTFTDSLNIRRMFGQTATLLNNGKVLVVGGYDVPVDTAHGVKLKDCELYDPITNTWSITDSLKYERWFHTATLMSDGKVLVCGGDTLPSEIFNPVTESWSIAASMKNKRYYHSSILLPDGNVLISGGYQSSSWLGDCELYNPSNDEWTVAGSMQFSRNMHYSFLLNSGLILFTGGEFGSTIWELYDPFSQQNVHWDYYLVDKFLPTMHLLQNGNVISIGGTSWEGISYFPTEMCEIYDPNLNTLLDNNDVIPGELKLYQNYPNPFNPSTTIEYYLPTNGNVKLRIYDIHGKLISILVNEVQNSGFHSFIFYSKELSSGVYFVRLEIVQSYKLIKIIKLK